MVEWKNLVEPKQKKNGSNEKKIYMVELKDCVESRKLVKAKFGQIEKLHHIEITIQMENPTPFEKLG